MIDARDLVRTFGRHHAVSGISFSLDRGGIYGFLGPNGAGKTTTIRMVTGSIPPTSGTLTLDGIDVVADPISARRRIGYLPEHTPLDLGARVRDHLRFRASLVGVPRNRRRAAIDRAIEQCDLTDVDRRPIRQLSKGYRQRVGLAAAIVHEPPVLVLDEPTVGLDPRQIVEVRGLVRRLAGRHTVILSTHILPEAESICDSVLLFARGRIRARGRLSDLRGGGEGDLARWTLLTRTAADAAIRSVPGVGTIAAADAPTGAIGSSLAITAAPDDADADALAIRLAEAAAPHGLLELRRERTTLEERFISIVTDADADDARDADDRVAGAAATPAAEVTS